MQIGCQCYPGGVHRRKCVLMSCLGTKTDHVKLESLICIFNQNYARQFPPLYLRHNAWSGILQRLLCFSSCCICVYSDQWFLKIYISQGSVATHLRCGGIITVFLQIVYRMCQWKNFENRLILGEVMDSDKVDVFFEAQCIGSGSFLLNYLVR